MATSTITIVFTATRDIVSAQLANHPEALNEFSRVVSEELRKRLGPDAGQAGSVRLSSVTVT